VVPQFLTWIEASSLGLFIRHSSVWLYGTINLSHILGVSALFGSILVLDLRLLGMWSRVPIGAMAKPVVPIAGTGFAIAAASGVCMLATTGTDYIGNPFLYIKFPAIFLGLVNVAVVTRLSAWRHRDVDPLPSASRRQLALAGGVSLACWLTAVAAGRLIAYW
jgi:hypothetical protein